MKLVGGPNRIVLQCAYGERGFAKDLGFDWDPIDKVWWTRSTWVAQQARLHPLIVVDPSAFAEPISTPKLRHLPAPKGESYLPYQLEGIVFCGQHEDVLLADEMGLGKTIQAIGLMNTMPEADVLILCPAGLRINWERELTKWLLPHMGIRPVIVPYSQLTKYRELTHSQCWDLLVCDEAHYLKERTSQRSKEVYGTRDHHGTYIQEPIRAHRKLFLTGTPIMNRPRELFPILNYLAPDEFPSWTRYRDRYCAPVQTRFGIEAWGASHLDELGERLRSTVMIRRTKEEVLPQLPEKRRQMILWEPNAKLKRLLFEEREAKEAYEKALAYSSGRRPSNAFKMLSQIAKARHAIGLAKLPLIIEHLEECLAANEKVVCFAYHRAVLSMLAAHFPDSALIWGGQSMSERQDQIDRFQGLPSYRILFGQIEAAGLGFNLTAAHLCVFAELDWVPAKIHQAEDRLHRIGQSSKVLVQHLLYEGSVDEDVIRSLMEKERILQAVL
jgi:SWI/SNF-related matrix-associated actin-dependent regulator 1 of chromatin subfamily A